MTLKSLAVVDSSEATRMPVNAPRALVEGVGGDVTPLPVVDLDLDTAGGF